MIRLILFFCVICSFSACEPNRKNLRTDLLYDASRNQHSREYMQKSVNFIKQVKGQILSEPEFVLDTRPFNDQYFRCLKEVLNDTAVYSHDELTFIKQKKYPPIGYWTKKLFANAKLVRSYNVVFKEIGHSFNMFSVPIFLRNYTFCLFYSQYVCGGRCGEGKLALYKITNNKWQEVKSYCHWFY